MFGVDDINKKRREVGSTYLKIPVVFLDGGQGFLPNVPYIRASKEPHCIHCRNQVASVSRIDDADRICKTHSCFTYTRPWVEVKSTRRGGGGGGRGRVGDTHTASNSQVQSPCAIHTGRTRNSRFGNGLSRDKIVYSITVFLSVGWHKKVEPGVGGGIGIGSGGGIDDFSVMLFDLLFVSGHPFSVVSVLREIDVEVVFSHYAYGYAYGYRMYAYVYVCYNTIIYVYIIYIHFIHFIHFISYVYRCYAP